MKTQFTLTILAALLSLTACHRSEFTPANPQYAAGEWRIEMQTPPCETGKNLQVVWPGEPGAPMTIECDLMPVAEK